MQADCAGFLGRAASPSPSCQGRSPLSKRGLNQMKPPGSFLAAGKGGAGCCVPWEQPFCRASSFLGGASLPRRRQERALGARPMRKDSPSAAASAPASRESSCGGVRSSPSQPSAAPGFGSIATGPGAGIFFCPSVFSSPRASPALALALGRKR